nr:23S rRNA (pseudouridine(1915)-N(3))-methyltransferase RlmH [bacterium]
MPIHLIVVGRIKQPGWRLVCEDYAKRLSRYDKLTIEELPDQPASGPEQARRAMALEAKAILAALPKGAHVVALDSHGRSVTSEGLAQNLAAWRQLGRPVALVIGGSEGLDGTVKQRADDLLSLSPMTLCHAGARAMLLEQLYRAATILAGHPYHK